MTKTKLHEGQFVRLNGQHERAGECGYIIEVQSATARFRFHYDGVETVQPFENFNPNTLLMFGVGM